MFTSRLAILSHVFEILHPSYGSSSSTSLSLESPMTSALAFSRSGDEMLETSLFILAGEGEIGVGLAGSSSSLDSIISTEHIFRFATLRVCWSAAGISKNVVGLDCGDDCLGEVEPPLEVFC